MALDPHPLEFLFHPRSVAVVGASSSAGMGAGFLMSLKEAGFPGKLYPVNPKAEQILDLRCYPRLAEVPGEVDYVISSVPSSVVRELVEDCASKGVKAIHFFTAGFRETGDAGRTELEQEIRRRTRELGIRVIGPNCMGLYCPETGLSFMPGLPCEPGEVAMVSQSGANAGDFCRSGGRRGLRFSKMISYGNGIDLDESDFLDYCAQDPATELVTAYIEGVKDGRRFLAALRRAAAAKPVLILKGGRTGAGGRATVSHTGSLAGTQRVFEGACRQAGALCVEDMDDLIDCAVAFRFVPGLAGPRVGLVGIGGGNSVLAADAADAAGLEVPPLPQQTRRELAAFTPVAGTSIRNPVDTNVGFGPEGERLMGETLRLVAGAPNIDLVFFQAPVGWGPSMRSGMPDPVEQARKVAASAAETREQLGKPVVLIVRPPQAPESAAAIAALHEDAGGLGLPTFTSVARAARTLRRVLDHQHRRRQARERNAPALGRREPAIAP